MNLSPETKDAFSSNVVHPEFLITIAFDKLIGQLLETDIHPASLPGSIRAATRQINVADTHDREYAFWPTIVNLPDISFQIDPLRSEVSPTQLTVQFSANAQFPHSLIEPGGTLTATMRIDLWIPGMKLEDIIRYFWGQVTASSFDRITQGISLTAQDGDPFREIKYPPGDIKLDIDEFTDIPLNVAGRFNRTIYLGPTNFPTLCPQVSDDTFYVADQEIAPHSIENDNPFSVQVNGENVASDDQAQGWEVEYRTPVSHILSALEVPGQMSLIKFKNALNLELPFITCSGFDDGFLSKDNPILILLRDYGKYHLSPESLQILKTLNFDLSVLNNVSDSILNIVKNRLLPQTPYMMGFRNGFLELFHLGGIQTSIELGLGYGLYDKLEETIGETDANQVYNAIKIGYHRNIHSQNELDLTLHAYLLDSQRATGSLKDLLLASEKRYDRRYLDLDFPDMTSNGIDVPHMIPIIGELILRLSAFQHQVYTYRAPWFPGIMLDVNHIIYLNDALRNIIHQPV